MLMPTPGMAETPPRSDGISAICVPCGSEPSGETTWPSTFAVCTSCNRKSTPLRSSPPPSVIDDAADGAVVPG